MTRGSTRPSARVALVTGASAGIGEAFARLYAAEGCDLVLTARREDRLRRLAAELGERFGVDAQVIAADLADPAAPAAIVEALRGRPVDILVNNAGYGLPGVYAETRWADQQAFLQVLLTAVCELTHRLLPGMIARRYGRVINVASLAGLVPGGPGSTLYGATKSFLVGFSESLNIETAESGVHVTALCPGFTWSEFHDANGARERVNRNVPRWAWQDAEAVARAGMRAVEANRAVAVPGLANKAIALLARLTPDAWALALMRAQAARFRQL
ncbi:MAG TPA: SDR family oxidoreductase [Phenylobacterium sp.]|nr:SDR family oxidoreductase [Phenylobacterium sp.]